MNDNVISLNAAREALQHLDAQVRLSGSAMPDWLTEAVITYGVAHNKELAKFQHTPVIDDPLASFDIITSNTEDQTWTFSTLGTVEGEDVELKAFTLRVYPHSRMDFTDTEVVHSGFVTSADEVLWALQVYFDWLTTAVGDGDVPSLLGVLPGLFATTIVNSLVVRKRLDSNGELILYFWRAKSAGDDGDFLEVRTHFDTIEALNP